MGAFLAIAAGLLLFGLLALLRLLILLSRDATMLTRRARMHVVALERDAAELQAQARIAADRAARLTPRRPRV